MFLPTTKTELKELNWDSVDIILVTGDTYIDSPYIGVAVIGKVLLNLGYRVAVIAQPDINSERDITRVGEPKLFWGVTAGSVDSMVANYTATKKRRKSDDYTPNGVNNKRPDRATIIYSNLIRRYFKDTAPIVLGGVEASLRRISHYDFHSNRVRKSILFDSKADILIYGMGERSVIEVAKAIEQKSSFESIRGICYISKERKEEYIELPSHSEILKDKFKYVDMFNLFYKNSDPISSKGLYQLQDSRYLIQNPPSLPLSELEMDRIYDLEYEREVHPYYAKFGKVKAQDTIKFSITTHRGCYGECNFCAIATHQGRTIQSRSEESILKEAKSFLKFKDFKGNILDVGGPTANMYGFECDKKLSKGACSNQRCIFPKVCSKLNLTHKRQIELLKEIRSIEGIKRVFIASGIRYDLINSDLEYGEAYLRDILKYHISGQMKIAPEHTEDRVLKAMGKPSNKELIKFKKIFERLNRELKKKQFLTYYFIAGHPNSSESNTQLAKKFIDRELKLSPEQVQIFTPTPSTYSTTMYYSELDPKSKKSIFVEKDINKRERQKLILTKSSNRKFKKR